MRASFAPTFALVQRELLVQLRSTRSLAALSFLTVIAVLIVWAGWPPTADVVWMQMSFSARQLFLSLSVLLLCGIAVIVPGLAAVSVLGERIAGNWDSLALTLIRPSRIVWAKFLSVASIYLVLILALTPFFASIMFLIGFDWRQVLVMLVLILCTVATCAAIGLACSSRFRTYTGALVMSYGMMLMLMGLPVLILAAIGVIAQVFDLNLRISNEAWFLSPLAVLVAFGEGGLDFSNFFAHLGYQSLYFLGGLIITWTGVRRAQEPAIPTDDKPSKSLARRLGKRAQSHAGSISDSANPVFAREVRWGGVIKRRRTWLAVLIALLAFTGVSVTAWALGVGTGFDPNVQIPFALLVQGVMTCAIVPALFANSFTKELEQRNADMLNMTLLQARTIVGGKFHAAISFVVLIWLAGVVGDLPMAFTIESYTGWQLYWVMGHGTILLGAILSVSLALLASILAKRTATALIAGQVMVGMTMVGFVILGFIISAIVGSGFEPEDPAGLLLFFISPAMAFLTVVIHNDRPDLVVPYWAANVFVFSLVNVGIYTLAVRVYEQRRMKEQ